MTEMTKPHIQRAQQYDGDGWVCYKFMDERGVGFGKTPCAAYKDWLNPYSMFKFWTGQKQ